MTQLLNYPFTLSASGLDPVSGPMRRRLIGTLALECMGVAVGILGAAPLKF